MTQYKEGDFVEYRPVGGPFTMVSTRGTITRVLTYTDTAGDTKIYAQASPERPRYEIKNYKTGKTTAYDDASIIGKIDE